AHLVAGDGDLLAAGRIHEHVAVAVLVDVLHLPFFDVGLLDLLARLVGPLEDGAGLQVPNLHAREGLALARLDELEVDDGERLAVDHHLHALADIARVHRKPRASTTPPLGRSWKMSRGGTRWGLPYGTTRAKLSGRFPLVAGDAVAVGGAEGPRAHARR